MADSTYPNTGSLINRGIDDNAGRTTTGLSTAIVIKVAGNAVGALQDFTLNQDRGLYEAVEIGTDGIIEVVPQSATKFKVTTNRLVFDQMRLPQAFSRAFVNIAAQRIGFDIEIFDLNYATGFITNAGQVTQENAAGSGIMVMKIVNCWFSSLSTPYKANDYTIIESANLTAETIQLVNPGANGIRNLDPQTDTAGIERLVNEGKRRGSLDVSGLVNSIFNNP